MKRSSNLRAVCASLVLVSVVLSACGDDAGPAESAAVTSAPARTETTTVAPVIDPGDGGSYSPVIDPADFGGVIDNAYLPMPVGARWRYEGTDDEGGTEIIDIVVTGERKQIMGVSAVVVRDTVTVDGVLVEDTYDWFAQDSSGNVWYFGEDVKNYEEGKLSDAEGSWEAGVDGAVPGIVMPAAPAAGDVYRQEFLAGSAEDMMEILTVGDSVEVTAGTFDDVVTTRDWTPLEPDTVEVKAYARGVGKLREEKTAGGTGYAELVEFSLTG